MYRMGFMPTNTPVPSALNSGYMPQAVSPAFGALALQSNPAHYGSPDSGDVKRGLAGAGAAGLGIVGGMIGAVVGSNLPFKDGALWGGIVGFVLPMLAFAPKAEESA